MRLKSDAVSTENNDGSNVDDGNGSDGIVDCNDENRASNFGSCDIKMTEVEDTCSADS